jgi:hypothetical protein
MIIDQFEQSRRAGWSRVAARVRWETAGRHPATLWFETPDEFGHCLTTSPNAMLASLAPLALAFGESRVRIDGEVSPRLFDGVQSALVAIAEVLGRQAPVVEPAGLAGAHAATDAKLAAFFSGGIDSLAMVRANRLSHGANGEESFRDGLLIFGLNTYDFLGDVPAPDRWTSFERHADRLQSLSKSIGLTLIRLATNVRSLYPDFESWAGVGSAGGLVGSAISLADRFRDVWLASDGNLQLTTPLVRQMHAQLQAVPLLATEGLAAHVGQEGVSRFDKVRLVAAWPEALRVVRPCLQIALPTGNRINCGECEKCLRTMLALVALDRLGSETSFPFRDVTAPMVSTLKLSDGRIAGFAELIAPLQDCGRDDLATALDRVLRTAAGVRLPEPSLWQRLSGRFSRGH